MYRQTNHISPNWIRDKNRTFPGSFFICPCSRRFRLSAQSPAIENNSSGIIHVSIENETIRQSLSVEQIFDSRSVEGVGENEIRIKQRLSVGQFLDSRSVEGEARNLRKKDPSPHTRACKARFPLQASNLIRFGVFVLCLFPEISPIGSIPGYREQFLRNLPRVYRI